MRPIPHDTGRHRMRVDGNSSRQVTCKVGGLLIASTTPEIYNSTHVLEASVDDLSINSRVKKIEGRAARDASDKGINARKVDSHDVLTPLRSPCL